MECSVFGYKCRNTRPSSPRRTSQQTVILRGQQVREVIFLAIRSQDLLVTCVETKMPSRAKQTQSNVYGTLGTTECSSLWNQPTINICIPTESPVITFSVAGLTLVTASYVCPAMHRSIRQPRAVSVTKIQAARNRRLKESTDA